MRRSQIGSWIVVGVAIFAVLVPLLWVMRIAVRPTEAFLANPSGLGGGVTFQNFSAAWTIGGLGAALVQSATVVIPGAILATVFAALAGWGLGRFIFPGRLLVTVVLAAAIFLPLAALVMPLFELGLSLNAVGHSWFLSLVYGTVFAPWATLFLRAVFADLPREIMEAAAIDGAGAARTFFLVALPMAAPAIGTAFILNVFLQWSELILALLLLPDANSQMVSVAIAQFSTQFRTGGPLTAAGLLIGAAPIFLLFLIGQRWLRAGALAGAVK